MLTPLQVRGYQELYKSHFGEELNFDDAYNQGVKLLRLVELIYKPITKSEYRSYSSTLSKKVINLKEPK